jgi:methionine-rich copper-binding protein CopC
MRFQTKIVAIAGAIAAFSALLLASVAFAHATVTKVEWDNPANPTKIIATANEDISSAPGSYSLRLITPGGAEVLLSNVSVSPANPTQITANIVGTLKPDLYTVRWFTKSAEDGDDASGSLTLLFAPPPSQPAAAAPAPAASAPGPAPVVRAPSTGDGGLVNSQAGASYDLAAVAGLVLATASVSLLWIRRRTS